MNSLLSTVSGYLSAFWKSGPSVSNQNTTSQTEISQLFEANLNQTISDRLPSCTLLKATLRETKEGKLSLHLGTGELLHFSDEKTMYNWLGDKQMVDIWEIQDQRIGHSGTFFLLQRENRWGYDTFESKTQLFDQLREDYGVLWKLRDLENNPTSYIHFKTGIFGNQYVNVEYQNLATLANTLKLEGFNPPAPTHQSDTSSWGKGIAACVLGGLLASAGKSLISDQNPVSDAIATLGPPAFKATFAFQMAALNGLDTLPGVLLAGMIFLPEAVKAQTLCPQLVGSYNTPGAGYHVTISGNYSYVADGTLGLQIIDVSNASNPTLAGFYDASDSVIGVAIFGNYAFLADGSAGLQIIDVSNTNSPTRVGFYDTPGLAFNVVVSGGYAYVADYDVGGLQIIDVSNVNNPTFAGSYDTPGHAQGVIVSGNYAYVADRGKGLQIIDISNAANPIFAGSLDTPGLARSVVVSGNYAYVTDRDNGLSIIDVSNKANPTLALGYDTSGWALDVTISGNYVYVANRYLGFQIIDVSNATNPMPAGSYSISSGAYGIALSSDYVHVTNFNTGGLQIIEWNVPCFTSSSSTISLSSTTSSSTSSSTTTGSSSSSSSSISTTTTLLSSTTTGSSSSSSSSISTTTTLLSSATSFPGASSTKTSSSTTSMDPTSSTTYSLSVTFLASRYTSSTSLSGERTSTTISDDFPYLWIILGIGGGAVVCCSLAGGITCFLKQRKRRLDSEEKLVDRNSTQMSRISDNFELKPTKEKSHTKIGGEYFQLSKISKEEAQEIYAQTGHIIAFSPGKKKVQHVIGKGNFGAIKVAQRIEDQTYVASKKVKDEENMRASEEEANLQRSAAGENILPIYNTIKLKEALYHFMPLAGYGSGMEIQKQLSTVSDSKFAMDVINFIAKDILTGLKTIHAKGIYHLDIKPENIVFTKDGTAHITDFGCAKKVEKQTPISFTALGDTRYFSPERLQAHRDHTTFNGEKADIWATGMLLLQLLNNQSPIQLFGMHKGLDRRIDQCTHDFFQEKLSDMESRLSQDEWGAWWIVKGLLDPNPETRYTAQQALQAPTLQGLNQEAKAELFKELKAERLGQQTGVEPSELQMDDYNNIPQVAPENLETEIYNTEEHQQYYVPVGGSFYT